MDGGGGPLVSGDDCCEAIIEVGDQTNHLRMSMVVGQRERDKVVMNTAERVGQVQPADTERLTSLLNLPEDGKELQVMLQTAKHAINEGLLGGCVQEVVAHHERQPSSLHQAGEDLADTWTVFRSAHVETVNCLISTVKTLCTLSILISSKNMPTPKLTVGAQFYLRLLWTYLFGIYSASVQMTTTFMWHELLARRGCDN